MSEKWVRFIEWSKNENVDMVDKTTIKLISTDTSYWFTHNTEDIYISLLEKMPTNELVRQIDNMIEKYGVDAWYFIYAVGDDLTFLMNNYIPRVQRLNQISLYSIKKFMNATRDLSGSEKREAFISFMDDENLERVLDQILFNKKASFDKSILDFLDGKITIKTVDWGVGQIMKAHPKKYDPKEVKQAIMERFIL